MRGSMESLCEQPSLDLGVKVVRVAGLDPADHQLDGGGALFVRYYVPTGDGRRLRVDTREVAFPCGGGGGDPSWGDLARFERWGGAERGGAAAATPAGIAFELRWRPRPASSGLAALLLGAAGARRRRASRVLARAELAWPEDDAAAAAEMRWLALSPAGRELGGGKAPRLLVEVSSTVRAAGAGGGGGKGVRRPGGRNECCGAGERCGQCGWVGNEEDMFLAATFSR